MPRLRSVLGRAYRGLAARLVRTNDDPTLLPPPSYHKPRADAVYGEAFRRCFEYLAGTGVRGDVLEFGTFRGFTARHFATLIREFKLDSTLHLFDSFEGLPDIDAEADRRSYEVAVNKVWFRGQMALENDIAARIRRSLSTILPESRVHVTKGFFEDTLDAHLPRGKAALVHLDCDLYSSSRQVLDRLIARDLLQDGCILLCDDYNCNRASPTMGERLALADAFEAQERFHHSPWFSYGWHAQAFFIHDGEPAAGVPKGAGLHAQEAHT